MQHARYGERGVAEVVEQRIKEMKAVQKKLIVARRSEREQRT